MNTSRRESFGFSAFFKRLSYATGYVAMVALLALNATLPSVQALSDEQIKLWDSKRIYVFDTDAGSCATGSSVSLEGELPAATIDELKNQDIAGKLAKMKEIYMQAEQKTGVSWLMLAAIHYREGNMTPGTSVFNGQPLGNYKNVDGVMLSADPNIDAEKAAEHLKKIAQSVYGVDVTTAKTAEALGQAFLSYNRGAMYKNWDKSWTESPYVMNHYDEAHMAMKWTDADSYTKPGGRKVNGVSGTTDSRPGALTVYKYLSTSADIQAVGAGTTTACADTSGGATIVGDVAFPLIMTKAEVDKKNRGLFRNNDTSRAGHPYIAYDLLAGPGTKVAAFMGGTVLGTESGNACGPRTTITIWNPESKLTITYIHVFFTSYIKKGDTVKAGQVIAEVGTANYGCGTPHLHIDANVTKGRPPCARPQNGGCSSENKSKFRSIGPQLYQTYEALPGGTSSL